MKIIVPVKTFIFTHKFIFIGLVVLFTITTSVVLFQNNNAKIAVLGKQTTANPTATPILSLTKQPSITIVPSVSKTQTKASIPSVNPTGGKTQSNTNISQSNSPTSTANQSSTNSNNTPTPGQPTSQPTAQTSSPQYNLNGVTFSSQHPTATLKPGERKTLFTMTATGNKNFEVFDFRIIGSNGLGLSEMSGSISGGQTKEIQITANPDAAPGTFSGFIGVTIDGVFHDQKLYPTITIEGTSSENTKSLRLTGPSAGSSYNQGDKITITWEASNISGDFSLSIEGNSGDTYSFANVPNSERSYTWEARKWFAPAATNFRFTVTGGEMIDHSDGDIIIN